MDLNRLQQLAGVPVTEARTISHYDHAGDQAKVTQAINSAVEALNQKGEQVTKENVLAWIKSRYQLSNAEFNAIRQQLEDEESGGAGSVEQQEKTSKWSIIAGIVHDLEQSGRDVQDIGRKKAADGTVYHEFMIDGEPFAIVDVTNLG